MTSAVPAPATQPGASQHHQQQQPQQQQPPPNNWRSSLANPPSTPAAASSSHHHHHHANSAVSPPSKRDLKSWWKGFKNKHQEQNGISAPSSVSITYVFPRVQPTRKHTVFSEDMDGLAKRSPSSAPFDKSLCATSRSRTSWGSKRFLQQAPCTLGPLPSPSGLPASWTKYRGQPAPSVLSVADICVPGLC